MVAHTSNPSTLSLRWDQQVDSRGTREDAQHTSLTPRHRHTHTPNTHHTYTHTPYPLTHIPHITHITHTTQTHITHTHPTTPQKHPHTPQPITHTHTHIPHTQTHITPTHTTSTRIPACTKQSKNYGMPMHTDLYKNLFSSILRKSNLLFAQKMTFVIPGFIKCVLGLLILSFRSVVGEFSNTF
jgi:hypothetical protein